MMKKGVLFINTRGTVVNTEDLIDALKVGHGAVGLDVYEKKKFFVTKKWGSFIHYFLVVLRLFDHRSD
jgi:D-lactate dehydrogenase